MNYSKNKHFVLGLLLETKLNFVEEYHEFRELLLSTDQIVKKSKLNFDDVKIILASLLGNEEIKFSTDENDRSGYQITNKGVSAYEDEKYLRIRKERSRATWSFFLSIASFVGSVIAILIALKQLEPSEHQPQKINETVSRPTFQKKDSLPQVKKNSLEGRKR
ncbi:MAG: hypothetical protein K0M56_00945 [Kaistella sp.]|nr:hypothetical protein [Kaistella sp.]